MLSFINNETPDQKLQNDINAMNDSLNLINSLLNEEILNEDIKFVLIQNRDHLQIMLQRQNIIDSGINTMCYLNAINDVNDFLVN